MLQERNQRRGNGNNLLRRNVDKINFRGRRDGWLAMNPHRNALVAQESVILGGIRLRDNILTLLKSVEIDDLIRQPAPAVRGFFDFAVGCLDKSIIIEMGIRSQVRDQADVRSLWRSDWAQAAIV